MLRDAPPTPARRIPPHTSMERQGENPPEAATTALAATFAAVSPVPKMLKKA
jgi:hypothetical protein